MITLQQFFESDTALAIHCDTRGKAKKLCEAFDKLGKKWSDGKSYLKYNYWNKLQKETCYTNCLTYSDKQWYLDIGFKVYEFEDIIFDEENYINDNVEKIFKILGIKPNEKFKIKFEGGNISCAFFWLTEELCLVSEDEKIKYLDALLFRLLNRKCKFVKLPKKKKLRDLTIEEFKNWKGNNCGVKRNCKNCSFSEVPCNFGSRDCWIKHKTVYNDNFLDQEVEILEEV